MNNLSSPEVQKSIAELENMIDGSVDSIEPAIEKLTEIFTRPYNNKKDAFINMPYVFGQKWTFGLFQKKRS